MNTQLLEIHPRELKFVCELKKQSSCVVHLTNATDQYVAFKVKTTSPKKYCVRPNVGIIKPKATYDFTVTMQAQKSVTLHCKDKFLVQSTVVPYGTDEDDITSGMFAKGSQKYVEETKLLVVLTYAPNSPESPPVEAVFNQDLSYEALKPKEQSPVLLPVVNGVVKQEPSYETLKPKDKLQNGDENFPPPDMLIKKVEVHKNVNNMDEPRAVKVMDNVKLEGRIGEFQEQKQTNDAEGSELKLRKEIEELRSKITAMDSKLIQAEYIISQLKEEKLSTSHRKEKPNQELASEHLEISTRTTGAKKIQVGFPPLFVCMVALICLAIGFLFRS